MEGICTRDKLNRFVFVSLFSAINRAYFENCLTKRAVTDRIAFASDISSQTAWRCTQVG